MIIGQNEKIDWFRIIIDLCSDKHGYTHATIGAAVGAPKSTVQGWKMGAEPRWKDGERLIHLWTSVTRNSRETVPTVGRHSYKA